MVLRKIALKIFSVFLITTLIGVVACKSTPEDTNAVDNASLAKLDSLGQSIIKKGEVVGFSVAIMKGTDTLYNRGFGYVDTAKIKSVSNTTRFKIASISKLIGSTLVMKLVEEEKLSLNQTLLELLPDFPNSEQAKKITLAHMISHTSGLPEYATAIDSMYVGTGKNPTKKDFYSFFATNGLLFEPGTNYSYCNSGFLLMGMIVERITQRSLQQEFDRVINEPGDMGLKLIAEADSLPEMSPYWEKKGNSYIPYPHWPWIKGDGGLTATSIMLAQFPKQWSLGIFIDSVSYQKMVTPRILADGIQTGYGLGVRNGEFFGEKIIGHTGGHKSTYAIMVYFPERDLTFVVFTNTDSTPSNSRNIFAQFAAEYLGFSVTPDSFNKQILKNPNNYTGDYIGFDSKIGGTIQIKKGEDQNLLYCIEDTCYPMTYLGNHKFWIAQWPYDYITFEVDDTGKALAIKEYFTGFYVMLRKRANSI